MIRKLIAIFVEAFVFLSCTSLIAQEKQKPMTNADVVEMVQSGMTEEAIVGAIKAATPNFEITNDSTTALSKQQISERVILAMIRRQIEWDQSHPKIKAQRYQAQVGSGISRRDFADPSCWRLAASTRSRGLFTRRIRGQRLLGETRFFMVFWRWR